MRTVFRLHGCQDQKCCERVERELMRVKRVRMVEVNLYRSTAAIDHDDGCNTSELVAAIGLAGCLGILVGSEDSVQGKGRFDA